MTLLANLAANTSPLLQGNLNIEDLSASKRGSASVYVLEDAREFARLEEQANCEGYRCDEEFSHIDLPNDAKVLDAGCGSGLLARYLTTRFPTATIVGVDAAIDRIEQARKLARTSKNIEFRSANLRRLPFPDASFDFVFCRYVLHHMPNDLTDRVEVLRELYRCIKPAGKAVFVEPDAMFYNLHPQTKAIERAFSIFQEKAPVDLFLGRKLGELLLRSGFAIHDWMVQPIVSRKRLLLQEYELMSERFDQLTPLLESMLAGSENAAEFRRDFLEALLRPDTIYYCNKIIVTGLKTH